MKKMLCLALLVAISSIAFARNAQSVPNNHDLKGHETMKKKENPTKVRMSFHQEEIIVELFDNPVSREFLSLLPLELEFDDYAHAEKIAYLPNKLKTQGPLGSEIKGDFTYYAPWGNLAVFYKGYGNAHGLFMIGRILSGKDRLAKMDSRFTAIIEKIE